VIRRYEVSESFKHECKSNFATNRQGKIRIIEDALDIVGENYEGKLVDFSIEDMCSVNNKFLGTTVAKKISVKILNPNNEINLENKEIEVYVGSNDEFIPMGNFIIDLPPENEEVKEKTSFIGYDYMIKFEIPYEDDNIYPINLKQFLENLCTKVGLTLGSETLVNENFTISTNPFTNNETCRTVLSAIAELCGGFAKIGRDNKVYIVTLNKENITETIDGNVYDTNFIKNNEWGEVNSLVIKSNEEIEGEYAIRQDAESIAQNGKTEIIIFDNPFLIYEEQRNFVIENLWQQLKGIKYLPFKTSYYGFPYIDSGDFIKILDCEDNEYYSYIFNHTFTFNGSFSGNIETAALTEMQTTYQSNNDIKSKFKRVELAVNKVDGEIQSVIEEQNEQTEKMSRLTQTVDSFSFEISNKVGEDEIISKINQSAETIQINANKVSLEGKEIDLTGDNITITSNNFSVDENGNVICKNADLSGKITATTGQIAGFNISSYALYKGTTDLYSNTAGIYIDSSGAIRVVDRDGSTTIRGYYTEYRYPDDNSYTHIGPAGLSIRKNTNSDGSYMPVGVKFYDEGSATYEIDDNGIRSVGNDNYVYYHGNGVPELRACIIQIENGYNYGLKNAYGVPIIRDHNNTNITVDATGGVLFLGYENTKSLNFFNGKATMDSSGNTHVKSFYATYISSSGGNINSNGGNHYTEGGKFDAAGGYLVVGNTRLNAIQKGEVTVTPSASNTPTSKWVTFGTKFGGTPNVVTGVRSSVSGTTVKGWAATGMATNGFNAWVTRSNTTATDIQWIAVY